MVTFAERLTEFLEDVKPALTKAQLAELLSVGPPMVTAYTKGGNKPSADALFLLAELTGLSLDWLRGAPTVAKWGPEVQTMQRWLWTQAVDLPGPDKFDVVDRYLHILELIKDRLPAAHQEWFLPGILGVSRDEFKRITAQEQPRSVMKDDSLLRLATFTTLPYVWIQLGEPQYLQRPAGARHGEWDTLVDRLVIYGHTPEEAVAHVDFFHEYLLEQRRLRPVTLPEREADK